MMMWMLTGVPVLLTLHGCCCRCTCVVMVITHPVIIAALLLSCCSTASLCLHGSLLPIRYSAYVNRCAWWKIVLNDSVWYWSYCQQSISVTVDSTQMSKCEPRTSSSQSTLFISQWNKVIYYGSQCDSLLKCSKWLVDRGYAVKPVKMFQFIWLVAWHSGRMLVCDRRTFPVLCSTCSWRVTTYVGQPSTIRSAN